MNKVEITAQLNAKYNELFPKFWEILIKKKEEPNNNEVLKVYNYLNSNIRYLDKYISLINNFNDENVEKEIEKMNTIKQLTDILYEPKQKTEIPYNSKIEILN
jgi:hypothetical protein